MTAANRIVSVPHHKLVEEYAVEQGYKAKRTDRKSEKWLLAHPDMVVNSGNTIMAEKVLGVHKHITYDTTENRFVKHILSSTVKRITAFVENYTRSNRYEEHVVNSADYMTKNIGRLLNTTFLKDVSAYNSNQSMSLVFGMAPG